MPKIVSVYQRDGTMYVIASHKTQAGFWVDDNNVLKLVSPQPLDIENALSSALDHSREGIATPSPSVDSSSPLLAASGIKSWNIFTKTAKYVGIRQDGDIIKVTPYKSLGGKDGFDPMQDKSILLPAGELGLSEVVIRALGLSE